MTGSDLPGGDIPRSDLSLAPTATTRSPAIPDLEARRRAMTAIDECLLVEAGAGSGKTAVMAGRIVVLLAAGRAPRSIAAITFTEAAASEIAQRVARFVDQALAGDLPPELEIAFPSPSGLPSPRGPDSAGHPAASLSETQRANLEAARGKLDQLTATTIHGFCQRLIAPYPVEAGIDPGARIVDPATADLAFADQLDAWLRERLSREADGDDLLAEIFVADSAGAVDSGPEKAWKLIDELARDLKTNRGARVADASRWSQDLERFSEAVAAFRAWLDGCGVAEESTEAAVAGFERLAAWFGPCSHFEADHEEQGEGKAEEKDLGSEVRRLCRAFFSPRPAAYTSSSDKFATWKAKGKWETAAKEAGRSKADGGLLNDGAKASYEACCEAYEALMAAVAGRVLQLLVDELQEVLRRYQAYKRSAALLDFDDLLHSAEELLARHPDVRHELGRRFAHILVDEFQDTDPLQVRILSMLCESEVLPPEEREDEEREDDSSQLRPGSLFLVGDPKQAIYRFRGADVATYLSVRRSWFRRSTPGSGGGEEHRERAQDPAQSGAPDTLIEITTNFRSFEPILDYVNDTFAEPLAADGQPGFASLSAFRREETRPEETQREETQREEAQREGGPREGISAGRVLALDFAVEPVKDKPSAREFRDAEAAAVARACRHLIATYEVRDKQASPGHGSADAAAGETGRPGYRACRPGFRACRPGDIALLAPAGSDLWRYEQALEDMGIPVATQAGKGFFRRQEIQDLIAITRILADPRDSLALGAYLRGPLLGLTEEALLDVTEALHVAETDRATEAEARVATEAKGATDAKGVTPAAIEAVSASPGSASETGEASPRPSTRRSPRLGLWTDPALVPNDLARWALERLQTLARRQRTTTPFHLLSEAVELLQVRPLLLQRHRGSAERALANLDLYLEMARAYDVRGLPAFAEAMRRSWEDAERSVEGRPDAEEQAVSLITMHSAKGLEWPIVIPINAASGIRGSSGSVVDRAGGQIFCRILGRSAPGYDETRAAEDAEREREIVRLWYVAQTRAKELLLIPRPDHPAPARSWARALDLKAEGLPAFDLPESLEPLPPAPRPEQAQTAERFQEEARTIASLGRRLVRVSPSRHEEPAPVPASGEADLRPAIERPGVEVATDPDTFIEASGVDGDGVAVPAGPWGIGAPAETDTPAIRGSRERGLVLHKLLEEILTGELVEEADALTARAAELVAELGLAPDASPDAGPCPAEIADSAARALALPEIVAARDRLIAECSVHAVRAIRTSADGEELAEALVGQAGEELVSGIADAVALADDGSVELVVDWKSDIDPAEATVELYRQQVGEYLAATGAARGLIVFATNGRVVEVAGV